MKERERDRDREMFLTCPDPDVPPIAFARDSAEEMNDPKFFRAFPDDTLKGANIFKPIKFDFTEMCYLLVYSYLKFKCWVKSKIENNIYLRTTVLIRLSDCKLFVFQ